MAPASDALFIGRSDLMIGGAIHLFSMNHVHGACVKLAFEKTAIQICLAERKQSRITCYYGWIAGIVSGIYNSSSQKSTL